MVMPWGGTLYSLGDACAIKYIGIGESRSVRTDPDRLASRILGMGDMLTLLKKEKAFDQKRRRTQKDGKPLSTGHSL
jgi:signal recognition particle GTPase